MIDILKAQVTKSMPQEEKLNRAREFLQMTALKIMYDKGWFQNLAFVGGTALRVLYDIKRFSEDLNFSLLKKEGYDFPKLTEHLSKEFQLNGFSVDVSKEKAKTVNSVFLRFGGLFKEMGISAPKDQKIAVKIEVDSHPPQGGRFQTTLISKTHLFSVTHYDLPSLYATKLCACFYRKYQKGRDFYDFIWYLGRRIKPDYDFLNNAIVQVTGENLALNDANIKNFLLEKIKTIDLKQAAHDVERFLEDKNDLKLFDAKLFDDSIESVFGS
jgi:predicted nucleotidyltransferase component of viral defense system